MAEGYLGGMYRTALIIALASAVAWGCASTPPPAPKPPPPAEPRTRVDQPAIHEEQPKLIAPPPAYGNKVVLACR